MSWGHLIFGFSGRINRAKYWLWVLLYFIAVIVLGIVVYFITDPDSSTTTMVAGILQLIFGIAALVSSLAVMTKRLHDRDKSAWWLLIFTFIPTVLLVVGMGASIYSAYSGGGEDLGQMGSFGAILSLIAAAILLWAFVELACLRGSIGPNKYGPDPLETGA